MIEREPKPFLPETLTGWIQLVTASLVLTGMLVAGIKYGWVLARGVEQFFEDIAAIRVEQGAIRDYLKDTNNRITALDTAVRAGKATQDAKLKELDSRAPKKGRDRELWDE